MALGKKPYPKATVKKIIKAHSNHNIKKNADVTVRPGRLSIATVLMFTCLRSSSTTSCSWKRMALTNLADIIH